MEIDTIQPVVAEEGELERMLPIEGEVAPAPQLTAEEAQTVEAFNKIQEAEEAKKAARPKKPSKKDVMLKHVPEGQQLYYNKFAPAPAVGMRVRVFDSHVWEDNAPVQGKYGMGPCILDTKVSSIELTEDGLIVRQCTAETGEVFELKRTGLWNLVTDKKIKKPHKRNIVRFGDRYDEISTEALLNIKNASTKKRKTDREVKALERRKARAEAKKPQAKKPQAKQVKKVASAPSVAAKKVKPAGKRVKKAPVEDSESSDSESSSSSSSDSEASDSESSSSSSSEEADPNTVAGEVLVDQIVAKVSAILDARLNKVLGKRKRSDAEKPAQKSPRKKAKVAPKAKKN